MKTTWYEGYMVSISFDKQISFSIYPYTQCLTDAKVSLLADSVLAKNIEELNMIISDKCLLEQETMKYYQSCAWRYLNIFEPIRNKIFLFLRKKGILPSFVSQRRFLVSSNYVCCESHRDILIHLLSSKEPNEK